MDEIDKSKENIQPLRQGRNPEQLCDALSEVKQRKHIAQMQQFEMRLRTYEGDDPLEPWFTYITWMEQTSTGRGKQFREVLKQCLKAFSAEQAYHNDSRLVDLWLKYLSVQPNRMEFYETVLGHGIGIRSAHFYQRWAADLEAAGDLRGADKIYMRGLDEDLDCRDVLEQALQRFQMRAAKIKPDESLSDANAPQRAVLGCLESRDGRVAAERPQIRPMGENRPMEKPIKDKSAFPVFMGGENEKPRRQLMKEIPDEKARVENEVAPKRWKEAASGKEARPLALTTPFKVLEDPTEAPPSAKFTASKRVLQEVKNSKPEAEFPLAYFEPVNDKVKPMYCKDKIYCGGTEFSFEELRAMTWQKKKAARAAKLAKEQPQKEEVPARKEIIMYETVRNGEEWSHEELRAQAYLAKLNERFDCPLAYFEPDNPNQVRMYDKQRVYSDNTEYSPEELRAKEWVARSQSGLLGQSMTLHTREALAAMQDLWHSTRESPPASPPKAAFNIFQDTKKAAAFEIFSDESKPVATFQIYSEPEDVKVEAPAPMGDFKIFSDKAKPIAPFQIYSENIETQAVSVQNGAFEIYSEDVKPTIPFQIYSETHIQEGDAKEKVSFGIFSDNQENVNNVLQKMSLAENYGKVLQPKFEIKSDEADEETDEEEEEDDEEPFEVKPLPPLPELPYVAPPSDWESNGPEGKENSSHSFVPKKPKQELFPDDDDTHFMVGPLGVGDINAFEDITVGLMKRPPPVESSTPFSHQPQSLLTMQPQEARHTMLSPILEMTGESRGSRSGSSSSGASSHCSKGFSFNLKTPGQSLVNEATHHYVAPVRLELLEEEEEVSVSKDRIGQDIAMDDPWSQGLQKQLVPFVEGVLFFDGSLPTCRVGNNLHLGRKSYKLKKILGEGAYGKVYRAEEPVVIKYLPNDTSAWEMHISRHLRSRVAPHLMEHFCEVSGTVMYSNGSILEMPFKSEMTLLNAINLNQNFSETTKAFLTCEILRVTEALMDAKIIHADIKPDNFILIPIKYGKTFHYHLQLIDFGRCIDLNLLPNARFTASLKGDTRCVAMRQQKPWSYDLDHYSAAATIHVVLFSKYLTPIEVRSVWRPTCKPKRFWGLASVFEKLLEVLINSADGNMIEFDEFISPLYKAAQVDKFVVNAELDAVFSLQV